MLRDYVVLRDLSRSGLGGPIGAGPSFEHESLPGARPTSRPSAPQLEHAELTPREVNDLSRDVSVAAVAPQMEIAPIRPLDDAPDVEADPLDGQATWGVAAVRASESAFTGAGVTVAVIDSGIDRAHPAFAGMDIVERDFSNSGPGDSDGHGTHCAGTIFGRDVGGTRIGVAPGVPRALIARVFGPGGGGGTMALSQAIQWSVEEGANILSMSLGFDFIGFVDRLVAQGIPRPSATSIAMTGLVANQRLFDSLVQLVRRSGAVGGGDAVIVAASGNESGRDRNPAFEVSAALPSAAEGIISVGAVARAVAGRHAIAGFSNSSPNVVGPGVGVISAEANAPGLVSLSGTSMATPHVAGVAALWWQAVSAGLPNDGIPRQVSAMVADRLRVNARRDLFAAGFDGGDFGEGLVTAPI